MCYKVCRELLEVIEQLYREDPDLKPLPYQLVAPPSPEELKAREDAIDAQCRQQRIIEEMQEHPAIRRPGCGWGGTFYIRKVEEDGITKDAFIRPYCGRHDCPCCWRRRVVKSYRRAARCLLYLPGKDRQVRVEDVHVGEMSWDDRTVFNRKIRRKHGKHCGRLHVRGEDDTLFVVCERPFPGSRAVPPGQALDLANAAIGRLNVARHSFRLLGCWSDKKPSSWKLLEHFEEAIDLQGVERALRELECKFWKFQRPEINGRIWENANEAEADALFRRLQERLSLGATFSNRPESDTAPEPPPEVSKPWYAGGLTDEDVSTPFG